MRLETADLLVLREELELLEHLVSQASLVTPVLQVRMVHRDQLARKDPRVGPDYPVLLVHQDSRVERVLQVPPETRV